MTDENSEITIKAAHQKLIEHAQNGKCTCNIGKNGAINVLNACVVGRKLTEEYKNFLKTVRAL